MPNQDNQKTSSTPNFYYENGEPASELDFSIEVFDTFPFYVILVDAALNIQFANQAAMSNLFLDTEDFLGKYCPQVVHGLSQPYPGCPLEEALQSGRPVEKEIFIEEKKRWFSSGAYPTNLRTQEGEVIILHIIRDITESKLSSQTLDSHYQEQDGLNKLFQNSLTDASLDEQFSLAIDLITSIPSLSLESKGGIFLIEEDPHVLVLKASRGLEKEITTCAKVPLGKCLCGRAAETGDVVYASSIDDRHEMTDENISPHGHYCVPIKSPEKTLGVICLYTKESAPRNSRIEGQLIKFADVLAGVIIQNQTRETLVSSLKKVRSALGGTLQVMSKAVETRDPYTSGHQQRVANLARAIATKLGLSEKQIDGIRMAASIHDIGKLAIPAEILGNPRRLSEKDFSLIKNHVQIGYELLKSIDFPWPVAQIILQHHERQNGSGYPNGLSGDEIMIEARVIAVADVIDAMVSNRPYRTVYSTQEALNEISRNEGGLFDPDVVAACLKLFADKVTYINK